MALVNRLEPTPLRTPRRATSPLDALSAVRAESNRFTWAVCDPGLLAEAVTTWTDQGNAITFGLTSDGGAVSVTMLAGGDRRKFYASSLEELEDLLKRICALKG